jgi:hypothetical protein
MRERKGLPIGYHIIRWWWEIDAPWNETKFCHHVLLRRGATQLWCSMKAPRSRWPLECMHAALPLLPATRYTYTHSRGKELLLLLIDRVVHSYKYMEVGVPFLLWRWPYFPISINECVRKKGSIRGRRSWRRRAVGVDTETHAIGKQGSARQALEMLLAVLLVLHHPSRTIQTG